MENFQEDELHDFITHRLSWRAALEIALNCADAPTEDSDDKSYWQHEIHAYDRAFDAIGTLLKTNFGGE